MKKTIKYLQDGEYHYATVKDVGDLEQLKTKHKEDLVTALNELFTTGGDATPTGYDDLVKKVNDTQTTIDGINSSITDVNGKVISNDEAIAQAKKDIQEALAQFQEFNEEMEEAKKEAETELANARQALKDEFSDNLAEAQKANQKQLEDKVAVIQGNLDTTSNTLNDVKTQLTNAQLDYGKVNVSIQKLNDMLATKISNTDLDPLKTSIQKQESEIQQTKDSIATKVGKAELDVLSGRVSTAESKIKQQADEISLGVKKSELNGAIDNYQVEGTNRLRDTIDFDIDNGYWKLDQYSINSNTDVHPYDQAHDISALVLQKTGSAKQDVDFTNEDLGQSFVISMWNKKDAQPQLWYGNTQLTNRQVSDIKGDYERSFFTFIPTDTHIKTIMFKYDAGTVDQLVIGEPKLELGTKPKAYAPNPNDEHKQIVNTKAELKIASDKIESAVEKQTKTDNNITQLSSRITQTEQGITATNDLITKTKDGLIKDYTGKINANAKSLSSEFEEKTNEKIGQITDSGENLILNSAFTNETDRKDKWQNISDKVNIVSDGNGLMWAKMSQSGLTADNPISLTSNYFPIKQGKITVGVDIKTLNPNELSGAKILVLQTYNANKQRVDFTELTLEDMGLSVAKIADGQSHRGVYRLGNDRSDAVYMTVKAVLPRNGSIYFTNFSAKLSSIDNGGYTPNAEDLKRQILNQKTKIEQNSQQITLKASSTELRDVRTIANGAVSSATNANKNASSAMNTANTANSNANQANSKITDIQTNGGGRNLLLGTRDFSGDWINFSTNWEKTGNTYNGLSVIETSGSWSGASQYYQVKKGETYTFSLFARYVSGTGSSAIYILLNSDPENGFTKGQVDNWNGAYSLDTNWKKCSITFTATTDGYIRPRMERTDNNTNTLQMCGYMLEKGTVAHEWQPAPDDIQSQIEQARTDIQSTLTVANNGITAATNLKTTYDNYVQKNDANIKLLGDRITNEVSKITSNGGGRNLAIGTSSNWTTVPDVDKWNLSTIATYPNAQAGDVFTVSVDTQSTKPLTYEIWQGSSQYIRDKFVTGDNVANASGTTHSHTTFTWPSGATQYLIVELRNITSDGSHASYKYKNVMLEKGTVAHDWSPAPEDTDSAIEAVSSKIDQTATSITSTVNSTKQDLQGQINSANTKITQTANSITEQLKSYSKTGDMQNYVNTTVKKTADGISAKVSGVESKVDSTNSKINDITSNGGGTNILRNTDPTKIDNVESSSTWVLGSGGNGQAKVITLPNVFVAKNGFEIYGNTSGNRDFTQRPVPWDNAKYVFSVYAKIADVSDSTSVDMMTRAWSNQVGRAVFENHYTLTSKNWVRVTMNIDASSFYTQSGVSLAFGLSGIGSIDLAEPMLEKGTVAHDWSPAPEDTDSAIQTTKADLVQQITDAKNAAIKVSKDSITSEVSDVRTTITQVDNKVDNIQIGGQNLLKDTDKMTNTNYWGLRGAKLSKAWYGAVEEGLALSSYNLQGNSSNPYIDYVPQIAFEQGTDYTVSFWTTAVDAPRLFLNSNDGDNHQHNNSQQNISLQASGRTYNGWKQVTSTFKPTVATAYLTFAVSTNWVSSFKLEKGNKATDWSSAPEDTDSAIQTTKADLVQQITDAKNAAIKVSKDSITSEVSDVRTTITQVDNKVDNIQIGGSNLLSGTSDVWTTITASGWMNATTAKSNKTSVADYHAGDKFTYSATVTNKSSSNVRLELYRCDKNGARIPANGGYVASPVVAPNTTAQRISCTISIDTNTWYVEHTLIADGGTSDSKTVQIKGEMFEVGTTPTAWKPNPHDEFGGGVNLLTGTSDKEWTNTYKSTWTEGLTYTVPPTSGGTYVLSFEAKASNNGNVMQSHWYSDGIAGSVNPVNNYVGSDGVEVDNGNSDGVMFTTLTTSWQRYFYLITARASGGNTKAIVGRLNDRKKVGTGSISIRKVKLEKGFYPTDWSPSPQDVATDISNVTTKVEQYKTKIDQNEKAIALKADQTVVDKTNGDVKLLQSELKVQSDKIESKVSQSDYNSAIIQLKNVISLHVSKGNVVSCINEEAGGNTLIRVADGKGKLLLNASSVEFSGSAFIPDAAISTINADKLRFYDNSGNVATMSAGLKQYDDDKTKKSIVLQYAGGYEVHASNILGSILTMHDNSIRLAVKAHGDSDMGSKDQYSGFYAMSHYAQLSCYRTDGRAPGIYITDDGYTIKGDYSGNGTKYGDLNITSPQIYVQGGNSVAISGGNAVQMQVNKTHAWLSDSMLHLYKDGDGGSTATQLRVEGWAWINGWVEAAGHSQHSALSTKTDIQSVDDDEMLKMVNDTDLTTFLYKTDVANGETHRHIGLIIDDVHDVAQYQTPQEFIAPNGVSRDDDNMIGALFGAVKALTKRIKTLESKVG